MMLAADFFSFPMGTLQERLSQEIPPGRWLITNPFRNYYFLGPGNTNPAYHTGVDILIEPGGGCGEPIHACANGEIIYAARALGSWGNLIIQHCILPDARHLYIRYAHSEPMLVKAGDDVIRGQVIAEESNAFGRFVCHCHLDFSLTTILRDHPDHWPGTNMPLLEANYIDPVTWIRSTRPMDDIDTQVSLLIEQADALLKSKAPPTTTPPVGVVMYVGVKIVPPDTLNLRSSTSIPPQPHQNDNVIGHLSRGTSVTVDDKNLTQPGWSSVLAVNGSQLAQPAWASTQYLQATPPNL